MHYPSNRDPVLYRFFSVQLGGEAGSPQSSLAALWWTVADIGFRVQLQLLFAALNKRGYVQFVYTGAGFGSGLIRRDILLQEIAVGGCGPRTAIHPVNSS